MTRADPAATTNIRELSLGEIRFRKLLKWFMFCVCVAVFPYFAGHKLHLSELYLIGVGVVWAGCGEMLFDLRHLQKEHRAGYMFIGVLFGSIILSLALAANWAETRESEEAAAVVTHNGQIEPSSGGNLVGRWWLLIAALAAGGSAACYSEANKPKPPASQPSNPADEKGRS